MSQKLQMGVLPCFSSSYGTPQSSTAGTRCASNHSVQAYPSVMASRVQRWMLWLCVAAVAVQIYVVRELLAALFLLGVVFAGALALVAIALLVQSAWKLSRTVVASAGALLARTSLTKA